MNTKEILPYEQYTGQFIQYSEAKKFDAYPESNYLYLIQNYYGQGAAMMTMHGYNSWRAYVRNHISQQGYKSNILKYQRPDLRQFAAHIGKKDCILLKEHGGKYVPADADVSEIGEHMVDMRMYSDWVKAARMNFSVINESDGSALGTRGNDFLIFQDGRGYRVSNLVGNMWKQAEVDWWQKGKGKIVQRLSLKEFIKKLPKEYKNEVKEFAL